MSNNYIKQATTNTGILHYVQDDDVKPAGGPVRIRTTEHAKKKARQ
jgi:hypothetical protein